MSQLPKNYSRSFSVLSTERLDELVSEVRHSLIEIGSEVRFHQAIWALSQPDIFEGEGKKLCSDLKHKT